MLLSRAPSCPPLTEPPTSALQQRGYDAMLPILRKAGMSGPDLTVPVDLGKTERDRAAAQWK
jgi:hypothetical protein